MLELTITSPYLIVDSDVQLSNPRTTNAYECFFELFKNGTSDRKGKGEYEEGGREGMGADFMFYSLIDII